MTEHLDDDGSLKTLRPLHPEPAILEEAWRGIFTASQRGVPKQKESWRVVRRIVRKDSTLFEVDLYSAADSVRTFYKQFHCPDRHVEVFWKKMAATSLSRCQAWTDRFNQRCETIGVRFARVLAVDTDKLVVVTEGIEGRPLGSLLGRRALLYAATRRQRNLARRIFEKLGEGIRRIEDCSTKARIRTDCYQSEVEADALLGQLQRAELFTPVKIVQVRDRLEELFVQDSSSLVYAHGDMGPHNMVQIGTGVGLFDGQFHARPRGYDLGYLAARLEHQTIWDRWARELVESLCRGYAEPDIERMSGWRFAKLWANLQLVRTVRFHEMAMRVIGSELAR